MRGGQDEGSGLELRLAVDEGGDGGVFRHGRLITGLGRVERGTRKACSRRDGVGKMIENGGGGSSGRK